MEKNARRSVVLVLFLISFVLMAYDAPAVNAADSSNASIRSGQSARWLVMASSNVNATWTTETYIPRGNYSAPVGSTINFTVTSVVGGRPRGVISIGNLVLTNVSMAETSVSLILGVYPFDSGLICPTNWDVQKQNATDNEFNNFTVEESKIGEIETVTFKYLSGILGNPYTYGTTVVYDKATGLLIHGYGYAYYVHEFMIDVALVSTNIDVGSVQSNRQALGATYVVVEIATIFGAAALITIFAVVLRRSTGGK